jgi:tRNA pseudouridine55 synthase
MDGVLVIDKPEGPTSHDVVAAARRALKERRIGHTGTLDPLATGVLPLVIGRATRLASLLSSADKEYEAVIRLGAATPTYDAAGRLPSAPPPSAPADVTLERIDAALEQFRGAYEQVPPAFSAKKVGGAAAYELARRNQPVALAPVEVVVRRLEVLGYEDGVVRLRVLASAGFYVRSLAHDLGAHLGCGGYLAALRRTRSGAFTLEQAVSLEALVTDPDGARGRFIPIAALLPELPGVTLNASGSVRAGHGNTLRPADLDAASAGLGLEPGSSVRLLSPTGSLVGIAVAGPDGFLRPRVVLV